MKRIETISEECINRYCKVYESYKGVYTCLIDSSISVLEDEIYVSDNSDKSGFDIFNYCDTNCNYKTESLIDIVDIYLHNTFKSEKLLELEFTVMRLEVFEIYLKYHFNNEKEFFELIKPMISKYIPKLKSTRKK